MGLPEDITSRELSPQAAEMVQRIRLAYKGAGKMAAAENYPPVLRKFLQWSEAAGHALNTLPANAPEAFLDAYNAPTLQSKDILRGQLKSIVNKITADFGVNLTHLEFGKAEAARLTAPEKRAKKAAQEMAAQSRMVEAAAAAKAGIGGVTQTDEGMTYALDLGDDMEMEQDMADNEEISVAQAPAIEAYGINGAPVAPSGASIAPQVLVVQAPIAEGDPLPGKAPKAPKAPKTEAAPVAVRAAAPVNSFVVNGVAFRGAYTRISRLADGLEPGVMPGSETILFVTPTATIARQGDAVQYLQQFVLPQLRFHPNATQVTFILEELTDKRQPTGVRMEVSVGLTNTMAGGSGTGAGGQLVHGAVPPAPAQPAPAAADPTLGFLLRNMENQIAEARRREADVAAKLEKESNAMMQMQLMQMQQRAADDRRAMEERMLEMKMRAEMGSGYGALNGVGAPAAATPMPDFFAQPPQPNPAEMLKPVLEQMGAMTTAMMQFAMRPPPPQKDAMEVVLPIILNMNQQMQQQQQAAADRQMEFMTALMTQGQKETPGEKFLASQLQYMEKRLEQKESNGSDFDRALGMIIKLKQVAPEIIGGGGGGGMLEMLIENADGILGGAAKLLGAASSGQPMTPQPIAPRQVQRPQQPARLPAPAAPQDDAVPVRKAAPVTATTVVAEKPAETVAETTEAAPAPEAAPEQPPENPLTPIVSQLVGLVAEDEFDTEPVIEGLKAYFTALSNMSERHQQIAGQIMTAFETADVYEDVYEVAKFLCATASMPVRGKHVRDLGQAMHGVYSEIYAAFFDGREKVLSDVGDDDEEMDEAEGEGAAA